MSPGRDLVTTKLYEVSLKTEQKVSFLLEFISIFMRHTNLRPVMRLCEQESANGSPITVLLRPKSDLRGHGGSGRRKGSTERRRWADSQRESREHQQWQLVDVPLGGKNKSTRFVIFYLISPQTENIS